MANIDQASMKSKERVLTAFKHKEPDRVPIDYSANPGIDQRLKAHYGLEQQDTEGLLRVLGVDFRGVGAPYTGLRLHAQPQQPNVQVSADWGLRTRYMEHGFGAYWEPWPGRIQITDVQDAVDYPMPSPDDYDYSQLKGQCEYYANFAVSTHAGFEVMNWTARHVGDEAMYIGLATGDPALLTFISRFVDIKYEILRRTLAAAEGGIDFLWIGEDLGTQRGPRISMKLFRERIRPIHQRFIDLAKAYGLPVMIHSCGSSSWAFDEFIDMGIDAVDTLQPEPTAMEPVYLKQRYGDKLAFHGCISTAGPVATSSVADTVAYCQHTLQVMMPGGGYCFAPTHQLQDNSPTENVVAMYEVARTFGVYA
jgi:uroporphyrinogen decarboxylase